MSVAFPTFDSSGRRCGLPHLWKLSAYVSLWLPGVVMNCRRSGTHRHRSIHRILTQAQVSMSRILGPDVHKPGRRVRHMRMSFIFRAP